jgi:hypothetical protein
MEVSGQFHAPAALSQGKSPWYPPDRSLGGPQSWSGRGGEEKNSQPLPGFEHPIIQPVSPALYRWANSTPVTVLWDVKNTTNWNFTAVKTSNLAPLQWTTPQRKKIVLRIVT